MCLNTEFWAGLADKGGEGAALVGVEGGWVRFHSTVQHIWAARTELPFPRLRRHSLNKITYVYMHLDEPLVVLKDL